MKKTLIILSLVLLISCRDKAGQKETETIVTEKESVSGSSAEPSREAEKEASKPLKKTAEARVNVASCPVRKEPWLPGETLTSVPRGTTLKPLSRSTWKEKDHYWYYISSSDHQGWIWGRWLNTQNTEELTEHEMRRPVLSSFSKGTPVDTSTLPVLKMQIFGAEMPDEIDIGEEPGISYNSFTNTMYMYRTPFPRGDIFLSAVSPSGKEYTHSLKKDDIYLQKEDSFTGEPLASPVISFSFYSSAFVEEGTWTIRAEYDDYSIEDTAFLRQDTLSVCKTEDPGPFIYHRSASLSYGETLYIKGQFSALAEYTLALYRINYDEKDEKGFSLTAEAAVDIKSDENGKFSVSFLTGNDMPPGSYELAMGEGLLHVYAWNLDVYISDK